MWKFIKIRRVIRLELDKDYNLTVGLRIREIRETFHMTRAAFSEKCDISESFLTAVESGKKSITSKTLYKICTSMNVSADYFIRGNNGDFETDTVLELLNSLDEHSRKSALIILNEYVTAIHHSQKNTPNDFQNTQKKERKI